MTLKGIVELLIDVAKNQPNIRYVGEGNIYDLNNKPDIEYGVFYITKQGVDVYENQIAFKLALFYVDRITDKWDNQLQVQSDGIRIIKNILNTVEDIEDVEINLPISFTTFNERFCDETAGVFTTVTITADNEMGYCYE